MPKRYRKTKRNAVIVTLVSTYGTVTSVKTQQRFVKFVSIRMESFINAYTFLIF